MELAQIPESRRALPLLFMFSVVLMGALYLARLGADLNYDGEVYISAASKYAVGMVTEGLAIYPMPLYPYLISLMHRIIPDWVLAGRLISYFFITLSVIPLYRLSMDLFNHQAAFWSCLAFILLPETLLHSNSVLREPGFCLFLYGRSISLKRLSNQKSSSISSARLFAVLSQPFSESKG